MWAPLSPEPPEGTWGVNFGGGVNSTVLLLMLEERGYRPDWVLFSDTGSERPETYVNVGRVKKWCESVGFPFETVKWIRKEGNFESVHDNCLRTNYLPSKAYGHAGCTYKWKIQPMEKWRKENGYLDSTVAIGYDVGERARVSKVRRACKDAEYSQSLLKLWYPLIAWRVDRELCLEHLDRMNWPVVKSSCFLCPHMRKSEWEGLYREHPDLFEIAVKVEEQAKEAGNADKASLFTRAGGDCLCLADDCSIEEDEAPKQERLF